MKKIGSLFLALLLAISLAVPAFATGTEEVETLTRALDYGDPENWAYFREGWDRDADVFLICPVVDIESYANALELSDGLKAAFLYALDLEKGIYAGSGRLFSPYYRQMSLNAYFLAPEQRARAEANAYLDISAAFRWYLDHENNGRPIILAGFSQGGQMCLELLKEYYGGESPEAGALRERLVAVYSIGWPVTEELTREYPQIIPARGETDTGTVISFDCEDGTLTGTIVIPAGIKALSINPLNWRTDGAVADRSMNAGAVMDKDAEAIPGLCGAYIGDRGELVVTDITPREYPAQLPGFPEGSYHIYDYLFFFTNLKRNVEARTAAFLAQRAFTDVPDGAWYREAADYVRDEGLMTGTGGAFRPGLDLTRGQLMTILWRRAGQPAVDGGLSFSDVEEGAWYAEAVRWAVGTNLAEGYGSGRFGVNDPVTREQMVSLLWRMNGRPDAGAADLSAYPDAGRISVWARDAVSWAVSSGVLRGRSGVLAPRDAVTRAEAAQLLLNDWKRDR